MPRKSLTDKNGNVRGMTKSDMAGFAATSDVLGGSAINQLKKLRGQRGKQKNPTKESVTLRLDRDVIDWFKRNGAGYQGRINKALRMFMKR